MNERTARLASPTRLGMQSLRNIWQRLSVALMLVMLTMTVQTAWAQTNVSNAEKLAEAFDDPTVSVINVTADITDVGNFSLDRDLTINLNGHTISGDELNFNVYEGCSLTINGEGEFGSVGNIISGYAEQNAIDNSGTVTLSHVNITTNSDHAILGGTLNIGDNVSFNGWTDMSFNTEDVNMTGNYYYDPGPSSANVVATVTVGGKTHYFENIGAALAYFANDPGNDGFSLLGDTYTIKTAADWDLFCDLQEIGETFSGKTVMLAGDIGTAAEPVTRMAGGSGHSFTGTFDGAGHTLTVQYGTPSEPVNQQFVAPFPVVEGAATFRNLTIAGSIYVDYTTTDENPQPGVGGLIGHLFGGVTIEGCTSTVEITSTRDRVGGFVGLCEHSVSFTDCVSSAVVHYSRAGNISGFVGWSRASEFTISFEGCLFNGKLLLANGQWYGGGFVGWKGDGKTVNITNCLYAPPIAADEKYESGGATFCSQHDDKNPAVITNCYYTHTLGNAQGKQAHTVTAGTDVTVAHAGVATHYATSGITAYKATGGADSDTFIAGLLYNNVLYAGSDDVVSLTLSNTGAPAGYSFDGYTVSASTLEGSTLTMPDEDVTISAALAPIDWATVNQGNSADPYMIYNKDQLLLLAHRVNGTSGETANTYQGMYFKLGADITFTHPENETDDYAENYEAIGGYIGGTFRFFKGKFDGDGHTVSGIRIRKTGSSNAHINQGLFGCIGSDADIHDVHLTDARITGYQSVGGIAGNNNEGYIMRCTVTDSYITATSNYGTICGSNSYTNRLRNNYYHGCKVANTPNAINVGCNNADVTANNGAVSIHTLTLADGITTSTPVTVTIGTTGYYAQGTAIALSYSGTPGNIPDGYQYEDGDGFTASAGTLNGNTLTMPAANVTVSALRSTGEPVEVSYVDAGGTTQTAQAIALDGHEAVDDYGNVNLAAGWYFVGTDIAFNHTLTLNGNVHLILADGCTMNVTGSNGIGVNDGGSLTIYGQTDGTGTLNATCLFAGIIASSGNINISGGTVTATSDNGYGISTDSGTINISGGTVTATGGNGIYTNSGTINISGGRVTATGNEGIHPENGTITLGCTTASDFIYVSSYVFGPEGKLNIADGQTLYDEGGKSYSGTLSYEDIPNGKTLRPLPNVLALYDSEDNTSVIAANTGSGKNVILYGRTLYKDGAWNTLCLPFDVELEGSPLDGATAKTVIGTTTSGNDLTINFGNPDSATEPVTVLKAGVPYIIKWEATNTNIVEPVFTGVTVVSSTEADRTVSVLDGDVKFVGYYDALSLDPAGSNDFAANVVPSIYYMTADNTLKHTGVARTLHTCRAYFQFDETDPNVGQSRQFILNFGDDDATGVAVIDNGKLIMDNEAGAVYDLQGRRVNGQWSMVNGRWSMVNGQWSMVNGQLKKGLYIVNGKKIVVK